MALHHHAHVSYEIAASEAAAHARTIMEKKIAGGVAGAQALVDHIFSSVPQDAVAPGRSVHFQAQHPLVDNGAPQQEEGKRSPGALLVAIGSNPALRVHKNALQQLSATAGVPFAYTQAMVESEHAWKRDLVSHVLGEHMHKEYAQKRMLFRAVDGELRAQLSDRYRRLDSRPLLEEFVQGCSDIGAIPCEGTVTDTRCALKAYLPVVFEPVPNEVMVFGIEFFNSDYGRGKFGIRSTVWRLWCTNRATLEDAMAQVHFGGRLDDAIEFSEHTQRLDTETAMSAMRDVIKGTLGPAKVNQTLALIRTADEQKVPWQGVSRMLGKTLSKKEVERVKEDFEGDDVVMLPPGQSLWRASNAVSLLAGKVESKERKLDLERLAGALLTGRRLTDLDASNADE